MMRKWMALFEGIDLTRLQAIAHDLMDLNDDVLPDELIDNFDGSPEDCLAVIERCYHSADCDVFAEVCQKLTGDQPYTIQCGFAHHTVLSHGDFDGPFYDVTGMVTLDEICKRYRFPKKKTEVVEGLVNWLDQDDEWTHNMVVDIIRYLKLIGRAPFSTFPLN